MKLINKIKELHMNARKAQDKELLSTYTLLISRADKDRLNYKAKSVDELTDAQMMKVIQAEVSSLKDELKYLKESTKVENAIATLVELLPEELTDEEIDVIVLKAIENVSASNKPVNIGTIIGESKLVFASMSSDKTLNMGKLSLVAKSKI